MFKLRVMSIVTKRARPAKMMLGEASSSFFIPVSRSAKMMLGEASSPFFSYQWLNNVKIRKYSKFEPAYHAVQEL